MKLKIFKCPTCKGLATGTLELLPGVAELNVDETGEADYSGTTDIQWDSQSSIKRRGKYILTCDNGHEWLSAITER